MLPAASFRQQAERALQLLLHRLGAAVDRRHAAAHGLLGRREGEGEGRKKVMGLLGCLLANLVSWMIFHSPRCCG
eukprot:365034-Chlamydomonas_euryale.AAC.4